MPTTSQLVRKGRNPTKMLATPQGRGVCTRVYTTTPKTPDSALREVARGPLDAAGVKAK